MNLLSPQQERIFFFSHEIHDLSNVALCCVFPTDKVGSVSGDSGHGSSHADVYDELFHTPSIGDLDPLDDDQEETGNKVCFCSHARLK